jgi:hypothetical protein
MYSYTSFNTFFCGTRVWTQGLHLEPLHQPYFCEGIFEIGSCELFAHAGFQPPSIWSLPPNYNCYNVALNLFQHFAFLFTWKNFSYIVWGRSLTLFFFLQTSYYFPNIILKLSIQLCISVYLSIIMSFFACIIGHSSWSFATIIFLVLMHYCILLTDEPEDEKDAWQFY